MRDRALFLEGFKLIGNGRTESGNGESCGNNGCFQDRTAKYHIGLHVGYAVQGLDPNRHGFFAPVVGKVLHDPVHLQNKYKRS